VAGFGDFTHASKVIAVPVMFRLALLGASRYPLVPFIERECVFGTDEPPPGVSVE